MLFQSDLKAVSVEEWLRCLFKPRPVWVWDLAMIPLPWWNLWCSDMSVTKLKLATTTLYKSMTQICFFTSKCKVHDYHILSWWYTSSNSVTRLYQAKFRMLYYRKPYLSIAGRLSFRPIQMCFQLGCPNIWLGIHYSLPFSNMLPFGIIQY